MDNRQPVFPLNTVKAALDAWRAYCRQHKPGHSFDDPDSGLILLGYLDGARALLEFAEQIPSAPTAPMARFVEELRQCYCQHYGLDPDATEGKRKRRRKRVRR